MLEDLLRRRKESPYPQFLIELVADMFAIVQYWEPPAIRACERGRLFESVFYRYCENRKIRLSERAGSRTLNGQRAASGFLHENDAVLATSDVSVHVELKHLTSALDKNELLIFNQKGLDFLFADNNLVRRTPLYRLIISASLLVPAARNFALQWGIVVVEPDRLPLLLVHYLSGHRVEGLRNVDFGVQDEIWSEVPKLIVPLQERVRQLSQAIDRTGKVVTDLRLDRALNGIERVAGDHYWNAMDRLDPMWLENRFEQLNREMNLDGFQ
jgi:hypothetical protein